MFPSDLAPILEEIRRIRKPLTHTVDSSDLITEVSIFPKYAFALIAVTENELRALEAKLQREMDEYDAGIEAERVRELKNRVPFDQFDAGAVL